MCMYVSSELQVLHIALKKKNIKWVGHLATAIQKRSGFRAGGTRGAIDPLILELKFIYTESLITIKAAFD